MTVPSPTAAVADAPRAAGAAAAVAAAVPSPGRPARGGANAPSAAVAATRAVAVAGLLALIALGLAWELWLAPTGRGTLALKVLPLLVPLAGLLRLRLRSYRAVSLLVWVYVAEGAVRAASDIGAGRWLAAFEVALGLLLFAACAAHVRGRLRNTRAAAAVAPRTA